MTEPDRNRLHWVVCGPVRFPESSTTAAFGRPLPARVTGMGGKRTILALSRSEIDRRSRLSHISRGVGGQEIDEAKIERLGPGLPGGGGLCAETKWKFTYGTG